MDSVWYYVRNGVQAGPVSFDELRAVADAGQLTGADLVWKEGTADWVPARTVSGLFTGPPPLPLPPPSTPEWTPPPGDFQAAPSRAGEVLALAGEFARRAAAPNPAAIQPNPFEDEALTKAGVTDPTARRYAVWRRAVLWASVVPTAFAALFGFINLLAMDKDESEALSGFGLFVLYVEALALFALPTCAVLAANAYDRLAASSRLVVLGAAITIGVPIAFAFIPAHLLLDLKLDKSATAEQVETARSGVGFVFGVYFYVLLLPTVLSLLPAASRACVRMKSFLPQSLVPGWGLVATVPLFVLLTLATFVLLYQFVGNFLLVLGLLLWIGAPLMYLTKFRLLTRPVTDRRDMDALAKTQFLVLGMITAGVILLIIYLFTAKLGQVSLVGTDKDKSLVRPWSLEIHKKWIEYVGRSLFLTVLFADLLLRMALSVWREEKAFAGSDGAAKFDDTMSGLSGAIEGRRGEPTAV